MRHLSKERAKRRARLSPAHKKGFDRFHQRLLRFKHENRLSQAQIDVLVEHLLRLGERGRNPANTGNIEDLFCHTLIDTMDPIRAFAQVLADSVKVVPMDHTARLRPTLRRLSTGQRYERVGDLIGMSDPDRMLVTHTMVAYGDTEMWRSAIEFVRTTHPNFSPPQLKREASKMAVQSQHLPSSSFVLARAHGLTVECKELWTLAGYSSKAIEAGQNFYDICAQFEPRWSLPFLEGVIPTDHSWNKWRRAYLKAREQLPIELIYQLSSDTLTNFLDGTLESGKWTDASVAFHGVRTPELLPQAIARIVNQYIAEHIALHSRPASEIADACANTLLPWGITFDKHRAVVLDHVPSKAAQLREQFEAARARLAPSSNSKD